MADVATYLAHYGMAQISQSIWRSIKRAPSPSVVRFAGSDRPDLTVVLRAQFIGGVVSEQRGVILRIGLPRPVVGPRHLLDRSGTRTLIWLVMIFPAVLLRPVRNA